MSGAVLCQLAIALLSGGSILLLARKNRLGFVLGLAGQPFWFWSSVAARQWGIFLLSLIYAGMHVYGFWNWRVR